MPKIILDEDEQDCPFIGGALDGQSKIVVYQEGELFRVAVMKPVAFAWYQIHKGALVALESEPVNPQSCNIS